MLKNFIIACFIAAFLPAFAQMSFTVSPPNYEFLVKPGELKTFTVTVDNFGDKPLHIKIYPNDWYLDENGNSNFFPANTLERTCSDWMYVNPQEFNIDGMSQEEIRITMAVPEYAYGDYWSILFFESTPFSASPQSMIMLNSRVGCAVYASIVGTLYRSGDISSLDFNTETGNAVIGYVNNGNVHTRIKTELQVMRNDTVIYENNLLSKLVMPEQNLKYEIPVETYLPEGLYKFIVKIDYGGEEILQGEKEIRVNQ